MYLAYQVLPDDPLAAPSRRRRVELGSGWSGLYAEGADSQRSREGNSGQGVGDAPRRQNEDGIHSDKSMHMRDTPID